MQDALHADGRDEHRRSVGPAEDGGLLFRYDKDMYMIAGGSGYGPEVEGEGRRNCQWMNRLGGKVIY